MNLSKIKNEVKNWCVSNNLFLDSCEMPLPDTLECGNRILMILNYENIGTLEANSLFIESIETSIEYFYLALKYKQHANLIPDNKDLVAYRYGKFEEYLKICIENKNDKNWSKCSELLADYYFCNDKKYKALNLYKDAILSGCLDNMVNIGSKLLKINENLGIKYLEKALELGNGVAAYLLFTHNCVILEDNENFDQKFNYLLLGSAIKCHTQDACLYQIINYLYNAIDNVHNYHNKLIIQNFITIINYKIDLIHNNFYNNAENNIQDVKFNNSNDYNLTIKFNVAENISNNVSRANNIKNMLSDIKNDHSIMTKINHCQYLFNVIHGIHL